MPSRLSIVRAPSLALAIAAACVGCDRTAAPVAPPAMMSLASPSEAPTPTVLSLHPIASLSPGRATMLAPLPGGLIFALQSDAANVGGSILEIRSGNPSPRPTALTADVVVASLGISKADSANAARGQFTAIAPCADGRLAFSFTGVAGARPFAALGTYTPETGEVFVNVDSITLANVDADLASDGARPSLFTAGDDAWLWRTAGGEVRLLAIDDLGLARPKLATKKISLEQVKDVVARSAWEWSATATRGEFLLTDTASRWIRKVDGLGQMTHVARFDETITTISPAALDAAGRIVVLGNDRDGITTCALIQDGDAFKAIPRDRFDIAGIDKTAPLRLDRLYWVPGTPNEFIAYDAASGRALRVNLK